MADDDTQKRDDTKALAPTRAEAPAKTDVVFVGPPCEDGEGFKVIRKRDDSIELGELRAAKEGKPLTGDLIRLAKRDDHERLFDVEVLHEAPKSRSLHGPAQVATDAYRANWDAIFQPPNRDLN